MVGKVRPLEEAVKLIQDGAVVAVNSSSGLLCPDAVLQALGERFDREGSPKGLTTVHPIAAGDLFGTKGVDHIAKPGMISRIIGGSYPSGPTNAEPPLIWQRILAEDVAAWNIPSGIVFDMLREGAAKRPGVLTKVGMDTFVDPRQDGCAMNESARKSPIVKLVEFDGEEWLHFPPVQPDIAIIRGTTADEKGNLSLSRYRSSCRRPRPPTIRQSPANCSGRCTRSVRLNSMSARSSPAVSPWS
jgi:acyl CoA:acetate/3-ketoacid CoA transferase